MAKLSAALLQSKLLITNRSGVTNPSLPELACRIGKMKAYCCFEPQARTQDYDAGRFGTRGRGKRACGVGPYSWSRSAVQQGVLENVRLLSANTIILNRIHYTRPDFSLHSSLTLLGFIFLVMAHSVYTHPLPFRLCGTGPPVSVCSYVPLTPAPLTPPNCNVASSGGAARGEASRSSFLCLRLPASTERKTLDSRDQALL